MSPPKSGRRRVEQRRGARVSYRLSARPQDQGCMWLALAGCCRAELPSRLEWPAPLVDVVAPRPVVCDCEQTEALYRWLDSLPTTVQVSVCCERQREQADSARRVPA